MKLMKDEPLQRSPRLNMTNHWIKIQVCLLKCWTVQGTSENLKGGLNIEPYRFWLPLKYLMLYFVIEMGCGKSNSPAVMFKERARKSHGLFVTHFLAPFGQVSRKCQRGFGSKTVFFFQHNGIAYCGTFPHWKLKFFGGHCFGILRLCLNHTAVSFFYSKWFKKNCLRDLSSQISSTTHGHWWHIHRGSHPSTGEMGEPMESLDTLWSHSSTAATKWQRNVGPPAPPPEGTERSRGGDQNLEICLWKVKIVCWRT